MLTYLVVSALVNAVLLAFNPLVKAVEKSNCIGPGVAISLVNLVLVKFVANPLHPLILPLPMIGAILSASLLPLTAFVTCFGVLHLASNFDTGFEIETLPSMFITSAVLAFLNFGLAAGMI